MVKKVDTTKHENKHANKDMEYVKYEEAFKMMGGGVPMRLLDDGNGMQLPGILVAMPQGVLVDSLKAFGIRGTDNISAMQMLYINIVPVGDNKHNVIRWYKQTDFKPESIWIPDFAVKQQVDAELAARMAARMKNGQADA